jgi:hypothetical protein
MLTLSTLLRSAQDQKKSSARLYQPSHYRYFHVSDRWRQNDNKDSSVTDAFASLFSELKKHTPKPKQTEKSADKEYELPLRKKDLEDDEEEQEEEEFTEEEDDELLSEERTPSDYAREIVDKLGIFKDQFEKLENSGVRTRKELEDFVAKEINAIDLYDEMQQQVMNGMDPDEIPSVVKNALDPTLMQHLHKVHR